MKFLKSIQFHPAFFFVVVALFFEGFYVGVTPPFQSPDELNHFYRAYQISEGDFLPVRQDDRLGGNMPVGLKEYFLPYLPATFMPKAKITPHDIQEANKASLSDTSRVFCDFPNTSYYSVVSYLPQSLFIFLIRQTTDSVVIIYYGAKLFSFLVWLSIVFFIIKALTVGKWLFTLIFLLPTNLYTVNSYSADTVTNVLSMLMLVLILNNMFSNKPITRGAVMGIVVVAALLALAKVIYIVLVVLVVLIPKEKFKSTKIRYAFITGVFLVAAVFAMYWSAIVTSHYVSYNDYNPYFRNNTTLAPASDYVLQKQHLLKHPMHLITLLYNAVFHNPEFYLRGYVGHFGTYLDSPIPNWLFISAYVVLVLIALGEKTEFTLSLKQRLFIFASVLITYILLIVSHHLSWNAVASPTIDSIQGRYLSPFFPLLFLLLTGLFKSSILGRVVTFLGVLFIFFINLYCVSLLYNRFYREQQVIINNFDCNIESTFEQGFLNTSEANIKLRHHHKRTNKIAFTGTHSLVLDNDSLNLSLIEYTKLKRDDFLHIEIWVKGEGACIQLTGIGEGQEVIKELQCSSNNFPKNGWKKLVLITNGFNCNPKLLTLQLCNTSKNPVYFDDLYCLWRQTN